MNTTHSTILVVAALLAPPALPAAQDLIDEVSVTAKRREAVAADVSSALSKVDAEAMELDKLVTDALADAPGVFLQQTTPGQGSAIVRGLKGSAVLHLVDGMRLNNAIFRSAPTQYLALVPVVAIDSLETVRGTPTSLYGSDAIGGVVQVLTRVPEFSAAETDVRGELALGFDSAELGRSARATLDAGNQRVAVSLGAEYMQSGNRRTGGGARIGPSGYESRGARALLAVTPDESRSWLFDLQWLEQPATPRVDELVPGFGQETPSSSEFAFRPNARTFAHARYRHAAGPLALDWVLDFAWQRIDDDRLARDFDAPVRRYEQNRSDLYGATVNASGASRVADWIVGAEVYVDRVQSARVEESLLDGQRTPVTSRFPDGSEQHQFAVFANSDFRIGGRQLLSAGVRLSRVDVELPATPVSASAKLDVDDVSGDLGWIVNIDDSLQFVANVGFGFRAPNVFDLGTLGNRPGNRFNVPNTSLDSEHVVQADVGLRWRAEMTSWEMMLFTLDYDDRITSVDTGELTPEGRDVVQSVNAATASIHGVEFAVERELTAALTMSAVIDYVRGRQKVAGELSEPADRIPPLAGRIEVNHAAGGRWLFDAWLRFARNQDRLSARDVRDVRIDPDGTAGWGVLGARVSRQSDAGWRVTLQLDNALDKRYRRHGSGLDAPGRGVSLGLSKAWD